MLNKEPILNIGIVLPQDKRSEIFLSFPNPENYLINFQNSKESHPSKNLTVLKNDGNIQITKIKNDKKAEGITVHNVPAGRKFHWEKMIDVTLPGNIQIIQHEDSILVINNVFLEDYLACVSVAEMSHSCPSEFLKCQTIAARSWILAGTEKKHIDLGIDACSDDCCQRYQGLEQQNPHSHSAVKSTHGTVLIYENEICDARYSKSCGGVTESCENVWDMKPKPYLKSIFDGTEKIDSIDWENWFSNVTDSFCSSKFIDENTISNYLGSVDQKKKYFRWNVQFTQNEFCDFFSQKINQNVSHIKNIDIINRGESGRINQLNLEYISKTKSIKTHQLNNEYDIRRTLHPSFLYSSAFIPKLSDTQIEFIGAGWGHGVGMCQIGALGMALNGYSAEEILSHYFQESSLKQLY